MKKIIHLIASVVVMLYAVGIQAQTENCYLEDQSFNQPLSFGASNHTITYNGEGILTLSDGFQATPSSNQVFTLSSNSFCTLPGGNDNLEINWVMTRSYDENGTITESTKEFYDERGKVLQKQSLNLSDNNVLANQTLNDAYGRPVLNTLSAPIQRTGFDYRPDFVQDASGNPYRFTHFDEGSKRLSPDAMGTERGSLGWYYSNENNYEPHVPASAYPYSRVEYYEDGTGYVKRSAGAGNAHRLGQGHESYAHTFPLMQELDGHYLSVRNSHVFPSNTRSTLANSGIKTISIETDGKTVVSFVDKEEKVLATAIPGGTHAVQTVQVNQKLALPSLYYASLSIASGTVPSSGKLKVKLHGGQYIQIYNRDAWQEGSTNNTTGLLFEGFANSQEVELAVSANAQSYINLQIRSLTAFSYEIEQNSGWNAPVSVQSTNSEERDGKEFYIPSGTTTVSLSNTLGLSPVSATITNIKNDQVYNLNLGSSANQNLPEGFYRMTFFNQEGSLEDYPLSDHYQGQVTLSYSYSLGDWAYKYYDDADRLVAAITPNGVEQLRNGANYADIDKTTYAYNYQGWMLSMTEKDAGRTEYMYRKDGKLRFSQDALQRSAGRYSYTNYDANGRIRELGEFDPSGTSLAFGSSALKAIMETTASNGGLSGGSRYDQTTTLYHVADPNFASESGLSGYTQDFMMGGASYIENDHNKTWYSYDAEGNTKWVAQRVHSLNRTFTVDYSYDFSGKITQIAYQKNNSAERFYHHYTYDADQRLSQVHTSRDGVNKELQATYHYYVHGPLKRAELANQLQGIDYVYTIHGWLKSINHPESSRDPGKDGANGFAPDVFGMTLEYFSGDYTRSGTNISSITPSGVAAQYSGNVQAMTWRTQKPSIAGGSTAPTAYSFTYDYVNQLQGAQWGTPNYSAGTFTAAANQYRVNGLDYDANGNIQSLQRYNQSGGSLHNFSYGYDPNSNRLRTVSSYASYNYDAIGQLTHEDLVNGTDKYLEYNSKGKLTAVYADAAHTQLRLSFAYDNQGFRLFKKDHSNGKETWYIRDDSGKLLSIYDNDNGGNTLTQKEVPVYGIGKLGNWYASDASTLYELKDHLGTVRATINRNKQSGGAADVNYYADYYPFGKVLASAGTPYRYGFQGDYAEKDPETGWNAFEARQYDPVVGRWTSVDPAREFASPYIGMGNNPMLYGDPDGRSLLKAAKALYNVGKRSYKRHKKGEDINLKSVGDDVKGELLDIADNITTLADGKWDFDDVVAVVDLVTGFGDEVKSVTKGSKVSDATTGGAYGKFDNQYDDAGKLATNKNHLPTVNSYKLAGFKVSNYMGSAHIISVADHKKFISTGSGKSAKIFRQAEAELLKAGEFLKAFDLNANAIKKNFGDKYDEALEKARKHFIENVIPILKEQLKAKQ